MEHARPQTHADQPLAQILAGPRQQPGIDRTLERGQHLGDAARRGDDDDHHHLRLQREHLDVPDRGGVKRRRRHHREQVGHLRQRLRRDAHGLLDLAPDERELEPAIAGQVLSGSEHAIHDVAMAGVRRHPPGGNMGMGEQAHLLEQRKFVSHGGRPAFQQRVGGDRLRRHRLPGLQIIVHHPAQDPLLPGGEHAVIVGAALAPPGAYRASSASALRMIWLPDCSATVSTIARPSATSRTVPLTTTSCSGRPMPRNWTFSRFKRSGPPAASV